MKYLLTLLLVLNFANASEEFPNIEPYAVEEAPIIKVTQVPVETTSVVKEPSVTEEEVVKEETNTMETTKLDDDNDGIINEKDECPDTSSDFMVDGYGCPQTMVLNIQFPSGKAKVTDKIIDDLKNFAQFLQDNPDYQVIIYGHTDNTGAEESNEKLSKERAEVVRRSRSKSSYRNRAYPIAHASYR